MSEKRFADLDGQSNLVPSLLDKDESNFFKDEAVTSPEPKDNPDKGRINWQKTLSRDDPELRVLLRIK
jgi:hypothetical protein